MFRRIGSGVIGAALATTLLAVGGCGVRGPLELPPEARAQQKTAGADAGQGKPAGTAAKPHKGFLLDGLLR